MLGEKQMQAFNEFYGSAFGNPVLGPKVTVLVHLAAAMASGCYP